jgi:hypothetical protein
LDDEGMEMPIAYLSKAFNCHEKNYGITDKEGCAATWAIRHWRPYLHGAQVVLITDHSALKSLVTRKALTSMRQQRYAMDLQEHHIEIVHRAGAILHMPDMLSRCGYGYGKDKKASLVAALEALEGDECNYKAMRSIFEPLRKQEHLQWMVSIAAQPQERGAAIPVRMLYDKLEKLQVGESLVQESEEETSRAVEMWGQALSYDKAGVSEVAAVCRHRSRAA